MTNQTKLAQMLHETAVDPTDARLARFIALLHDSQLWLPVRLLSPSQFEVMVLTGLDDIQYLPLYTSREKASAESQDVVPVTFLQWQALLADTEAIAAVTIDPEGVNLVLWPQDLTQVAS